MKEIWREIEGYEGKYEVSNKGNVRSLNYRNTKRSHQLKPITNKKIYLMVGLCKNGKMSIKKIHRLVAKAFLPNPENKPQVNHINGIKTDNRAENLEWCNNSENQLHAYKNGLNHASKEHGKWLGNSYKDNLIKHNKQRAKQVEAINIKTGETSLFESAAEIERVLKIDHSTVSKICKGKQKESKGYTFSYAKRG